MLNWVCLLEKATFSSSSIRPLTNGPSQCLHQSEQGCQSIITQVWIGVLTILVPRAHDPSGLWQESRALALSNTGSPQFTDFPSNLANLILCACSENRVRPELSIPATGQKDRGLWGREWPRLTLGLCSCAERQEFNDVPVFGWPVHECGIEKKNRLVSSP